MAHEKILVVEDESDITELIGYNLKREGYKTFFVTTGEECLSLVGKIAPELILLDLMLPGIDGLEVCKQLKQNSETRYIPIIMLTAKSEETDVIT